MVQTFARTFRTLSAAAALGALVACGSSLPKPVVDFDPAHDFSEETKIGFYALSGKQTGENPLEMTEFQKKRIDDALARNLRNKGYTIVDNAADADLLISWHLNTSEKTDVRTYNSPGVGMSAGYSRYNRYAMYSCYNCMNNTEVKVDNYTQGTFIVDMIDPDRKQSVWRSVTQSKLKGQVSNEEELNAAADLVLAGFPPGSGSTP